MTPAQMTALERRLARMERRQQRIEVLLVVILLTGLAVAMSLGFADALMWLAIFGALTLFLAGMRAARDGARRDPLDE